MGTYREAVEDFLNGSDTANYGITVPTITLHEHFGALKYGFGYNTEQEVTENLRVFGRFGWNEGQHESFAYTEVDQTVELGATTPEPAGIAPWTRSAWPSSPTPSRPTTRSI
jgi:high affinity Mn2+ porin